jgi:2-methylcitrate dehydratase PrpD
MLDGPAVPDGLAVKIYPCCYALQRPIATVLAAAENASGTIKHVRVRTPHSSVHPLIHDRPRTGLEGKFSLPYGLATALLDGFPTLTSFSDEAVSRACTQRMLRRVTTDLSPNGQGLLAGSCSVEIEFLDGRRADATLEAAPGAPGRALRDEQLQAKLVACTGPSVTQEILVAGWAGAPALLRRKLDRPRPVRR